VAWAVVVPQEAWEVEAVVLPVWAVVWAVVQAVITVVVVKEVKEEVKKEAKKEVKREEREKKKEVRKKRSRSACLLASTSPLSSLVYESRLSKSWCISLGAFGVFSGYLAGFMALNGSKNKGRSRNLGLL
jgi:hypothetical protein